MKLSDLTELILIESGEFILGDDIANTNLSLNKFWRVVKRSLKLYSQYRSCIRKQNIEVANGFYTYTEAGSTYGIPDWISSVIPVGLSNTAAMYNYYMNVPYNKEEYTMLEIPRKFHWKYESPTLYVTENGKMDVTEHHQHSYTESFESDGASIAEVDMPTLTEGEDRLFIDLVMSLFLLSIGRSRRAFTLEDLPISMDGEELVREGNELWEKTMEKLQNQSNWWEALGTM